MPQQLELIHIKIYAPFKVYFDGPGLSFSATNDTGPFDILARHKNFMSLLRPGTIKVRQPDTKEFAMEISRGVMHVKDNKVTVFLDI
ncbi:F0F1 ATP synthase subunit epsilon [Candidatus Saccharibacteria bacterium]|nr:F0F1 ATP synthase subunit epsilon [Candidatus Saccharibacteria bacterium]